MDIPKLRASEGEPWMLCCSSSGVQATLKQFLEVTDLLLERVQLNSTHLFRADIIHDSTGQLETLAQKEAKCDFSSSSQTSVGVQDHHCLSLTPPPLQDYQHQRTVVRRLIPRKPQLDNPLEQSCFVYKGGGDTDEALVVYVPHCSETDMPWYHPKVKALCYRFIQGDTDQATLEVYCQPLPNTDSPLPDRLQRTFQSLLSTMVRLLKLPSKSDTAKHAQQPNGKLDPVNMPLTASTLKDTILPQHIVQNTYTSLKETYASDLISRWVEKTEPSKHVFEDLSIAAFLVELWTTTYGSKSSFPGFVDLACGNGVLTYILVSEGWQGRGFDARRRKTWEVLGIDGTHLEEKICIPRPFLDCAHPADLEDMDVLDGIFSAGTFIISNHADELTCWTPLLAALSSPTSPLPYLAIPCCSHALDGSRHRYTLKEVAAGLGTNHQRIDEKTDSQNDGNPATGDLKKLRAAKTNTDTSTYACLTRKTAALAQELGHGVDITLMRIPSTRNIGIVGNCKRIARSRSQDKPRVGNGEQDVVDELQSLNLQDNNDTGSSTPRTSQETINAILQRECSLTGGLQTSARIWIEKAKRLQGGQGRGKVNWNGAQPPHA
ncbi:tRNA(Ser) Um(44) 2'-O-methyltransferase [Lithohypha guttulata]|uniref:tRNA(Ser) Um(44) 2'-O-methyltransferase n=1 Tax=Lithohypha guttulata TaxID=1690604 RepID=UPI00315CEFB6